MQKKLLTGCLSLFLGAILIGCNHDDDSKEESNTGMGSLSIGITDAPIDSAKNVFVQFSGVEVKGEELHTFTFEPRKIDLLTLSGRSSESLLTDEELPVGSYQWIRLMVDTEAELDTYLVLEDDSIHELSIPSGSQTGLKINSGFSLTESDELSFMIDFDVRKSIVGNKNGYKLKPVLRLTRASTSGHIAGTVSETLLSGTCTEPVVYAYSGSVDTPMDIRGESTDPVATALVEFNEDSSTYTYEVGFLEAGTVTLSLTCEAGDDDPESDDDILFFSTMEVEVKMEEITSANFE